MSPQRLTLDQINDPTHLPNGLHDAEISAFTYDLAAQTLFFEVNVWIGTMDQPPRERETYRRARLEFTGVTFFTKSEPEKNEDTQLSFLDWTLDPSAELAARLSLSASHLKCFSFYVLCCQIDIVCQDVHLVWLAGPVPCF